MWTKWTALRKIKLTKEPQWISIYQANDEYSIRIFKLTLENNRIPALIFDQRDSSYNSFGYVYLQVKVEDKDKAIKLLNLADE